MADSWKLEVQTQTEHLGDYCTLAHGIRYDGGSMELRQRIEDTPDGYKEGQNRAALVAAAPEMYKALQGLLDMGGALVSLYCSKQEWKPRADAAIAALKKARGGQ